MADLTALLAALLDADLAPARESALIDHLAHHPADLNAALAALDEGAELAQALGSPRLDPSPSALDEALEALTSAVEAALRLRLSHSSGGLAGLFASGPRSAALLAEAALLTETKLLVGTRGFPLNRYFILPNIFLYIVYISFYYQL